MSDQGKDHLMQAPIVRHAILDVVEQYLASKVVLYLVLLPQSPHMVLDHGGPASLLGGGCHGPESLGIEVRVCIVYYISCGVLLHWHLGSSLLMLLI